MAQNKGKKEIEVRFTVDSVDRIRDLLKRMGLVCVWAGTESSIYFDWPKRSMRQTGAVLRLREWPGHSIFLTYKAPYESKKRQAFKERMEYEIEVKDAGATFHFFKAMGFAPYFAYKKKREHWEGTTVHVELDTLEDGSQWVEIEGSRSSIQECARALGLSWDQATTEGYIRTIERIRAKKEKSKKPHR